MKIARFAHGMYTKSFLNLVETTKKNCAEPALDVLLFWIQTFALFRCNIRLHCNCCRIVENIKRKRIMAQLSAKAKCLTSWITLGNLSLSFHKEFVDPKYVHIFLIHRCKKYMKGFEKGVSRIVKVWEGDKERGKNLYMSLIWIGMSVFNNFVSVAP